MLALTAALGLQACGRQQAEKPPDEVPVRSVAPDSPSGPSLDSEAELEAGTREMVQRLAEHAAGLDPIENGFDAAAWLDRYELAPTPEAFGQQILHSTELAERLLSAGRTEDAIARYESLIALLESVAEENDPALIETGLARLRPELAIAHLRLGEQENCLLNHSIDSCLLPIQGEGIHELRRGSEAAVALYSEILERDPEDLTSRWLLNIAHMTLGSHPEGLPAELRIDVSRFDSDIDFPRFLDHAPALGLAEIGQAGSTVMEDFDLDGDLDILASSWGYSDPLRYYENQGDGRFEERGTEAGLDGITGGLNMVHGDYDNDGLADVYILRGAWRSEAGRRPNSLLRNLGDGRFADVTAAAGMLSFYPTQAAAWADYDNDGNLDLFVANEDEGQGLHPPELYRNLGDGRFEEVAALAGIRSLGYMKGAAWGDHDNDGRQDLYVSRSPQGNLFYRNLGPDAAGIWRFEEQALQAGIAGPDWSFMPWFWDLDHDGWLDLFVAGYEADYAPAGNRISTEYVVRDYLGDGPEISRPALYRNLGNGQFENQIQGSGLDRVLYVMGCNYGDLDNDGLHDLYLGTGEPSFQALMPNRAFVSRLEPDGRPRFLDVTTAGGFGNIQKGHGVAFGDLDRDGDQDMYMVMGGALSGDLYQNILFLNPGWPDRRWVTLSLEGRESNRSAIGARIRVSVVGADGLARDFHHLVGGGGGFGGNSLQAEIGLGEARSLEALEITWPATGKIERLTGLEMNAAYHIVEGSGAARPRDEAPIDLGGAAMLEHMEHGESSGAQP